MGCGRIAGKHAEALTGKVAGARLVAVCDVRTDRAAAVGARHGVPGYAGIEELVAREQVDVVNVLTPSGLHAAHAVQVARLKKHAVVEKPMALTLDDADSMIRECDANGVRLFVVKQNRYNPPVQLLRRALDAGRFGKMVLGTVRVRWCRRQEYYDQDAWRGTWALDGGVFTNQASHHVDLLEWMMGDVDSVFAKASTRLVRIETEDTGVAVLKFRSGALGVIEATTATRPRDLEGSISILGERGAVEIGGFAVNELKVWQFQDQTPEDDRALAAVAEPIANVYGHGHVAFLQNVVSSIRDRQKALVDGLEGRKSLELINAIYESAETGREIFLRFSPQKCRLGQAGHDG
jgi:predicted dehydrogenase